MDYVNDLNKNGIVIIYPDGEVEKMAINSTMDFHMEYMVYLINHSKRLKTIIEANNYQLPTEPINIRLSITYDLDKLLAENGIITFHNYRIGLENPDSLDDPVVAEALEKDYSITLPKELTYIQKKMLGSIIDDYNLLNVYYGAIRNDTLLDITFEEVEQMVEKEHEKTI